MTRRYIPVHRFDPDTEATDWQDKPFCRRCGFPRKSWLHTEWVEPEPDRSDAILGEHNNEEAA